MCCRRFPWRALGYFFFGSGGIAQFSPLSARLGFFDSAVRMTKKRFQSGPSIVYITGGTAAWSLVAVHTAGWAKPRAVLAAQRLHRLRHDELLPRWLTKIKYMVLVD
jgi:hypothetical protein